MERLHFSDFPMPLIPTPMGERIEMVFWKKPDTLLLPREEIKKLRIEDLEFGDEFDPDFVNEHYSKKGAHKHRSIQTPRKNSRRR